MNNEQNQKVEASMLRTLLIDSLLVLFLFGLFTVSLNIKRKIEENLKQSLQTMQSAVANLEEENLRQRVKLKTTVHDLKNPIGSILGFTEILEESIHSKTSVMEFSEMIKQISQRSLKLVGSLLDDDKYTPAIVKPIDLTTVIAEICAQIGVQAHQKHQKIIQQVDISSAPIRASKLKIEELLSNLLSNAIKYSPTSSEIKVRCFQKDIWVRVEIEDQGPGFTEDDKKKAFQFGQKLSAQPTGHESSTGFGLFTAKQIVEVYGGSIGIMNGSRGACLAFEIPLAVETSLASFHEVPQQEISDAK